MYGQQPIVLPAAAQIAICYLHQALIISADAGALLGEACSVREGGKQEGVVLPGC